jgi:peptide/nickel transport system permease protein
VRNSPYFLWHSQALRLIVRRLLQVIPVIIGVTFSSFCMLNLLPGSTVQALLGANATPALEHELTLRLHLNQPFFVRYFKWLGDLVTGHLGTSLANGQPVTSILAQRLPVTLEVVLLSFLVSLIVSIPIAVLAAHRPRGWFDRASIAVSMFGFSCPQFVLGLLLILIFAVHFGVLPAIGFVPLSAGIWPNLDHMVLPVASLSFGLVCGQTRILRGDLVDQIQSQDYIVTARAKGQSSWRILIRHALRNSIFGLITVVALNFGALIGGAVIIEQIFALPGMGQELLQAINNRDVVVVDSIVTLIAVAVVVGGLLADLLYAVVDPRIRYGR